MQRRAGFSGAAGSPCRVDGRTVQCILERPMIAQRASSIVSASSKDAVGPSVPCRYCDGASFMPLYTGVQDRLRYVPGQWDFHRCLQCGAAILCAVP